MKMVSILIPTYNSEKWLAETILSALNQTWASKEIIVVDDGSTDGTLSVARCFESRAVNVATQPNQGASAARNSALQLAQGEYIQWLDADDLLAPDKIEKQMEAAERLGNKRLLLSSAWGHFFHRASKAQFFPTALWADLTPVDWLSRKMEQNLQMPNFTWLVSSELTQAAGPWDTRLTLDDDGEYFCRVLLASEGVRFVAGAKGYYRRSSDFSQGQIDGSTEKLRSQLLSNNLHISYLRSLENSERTRKVCLIFLQTYMSLFHPDRMDLVLEMKQAAAELGGNLEVPPFSWKYACIQYFFGWRAAKRIQSFYNRLKSSILRTWDRVFLQLTAR